MTRNEAARKRAEADPTGIVYAVLQTLGERMATLIHEAAERDDEQGEIARSAQSMIAMYMRDCLDAGGAVLPFAKTSPYLARAICEVLADLLAPVESDYAPSLLALVVEAIPVEVEPETRPDRRILPRVVVSESRPERMAGMLFGGLHEGRRIGAPELPLFPEVAPAKRVPILDLVDMAGLPVMVRGRGAPLPMRLFVRSLASVRPEHRRLPTVRLALTLRDGLFPNGWQRNRDWPKLRDALVHARDYAIHDGRGRWWPLALRSMPDHPGLDDLIVLDVAFPPGSHSGPVIDLPGMDTLSVDSAARWRAYIASHSLAWQPGTTRVPPRRGARFVWTRDRTAYPVLTVDDRRRLAFGSGDVKHRTRTEIDAAFRDLPGLVVVSESEDRAQTREVGWLVLPEAAASAIGHEPDAD